MFIKLYLFFNLINIRQFLTNFSFLNSFALFFSLFTFLLFCLAFLGIFTYFFHHIDQSYYYYLFYIKINPKQQLLKQIQKTLIEDKVEMVYGSIISVFDRLSIKTTLTHHTGSIIGFVATVGFIVACLAILIPPVNEYFKGTYFQSQFKSNQQPKSQFILGDDVILALSFRNKLTGQYANHAQILQQLNSYLYYVGQDNVYKTELKGCKKQLFKDSLNPIQVKDCIMMPPGLLYDSKVVNGQVPVLEFNLLMKCDDVFKCNDNNPQKQEASKFIKNLSINYYYEFIFNSKVIDDKGTLRNQFHKIYSTQYESPDGFNSGVYVQMGQKKYFVDDSILPWWSNRTYQTINWPGSTVGYDTSQNFVQLLGIVADYRIRNDYSYVYRYYKKLDFILGIIGGCIFLLFLIFWLPFSYINRTLQKMKNAEQLLLLKDDIITTEQNLHKINFPFYHVFTRYLPGNTDNKIIGQAENQIDIVRLIKKVKVTHRNLRTKGVDLSFKSKDIDLQSIEPEQFVPDRPGLQSLQITWDSYQALTQSRNTSQIYQNNPVVLSLLPNSNNKIDEVMQDQIYQKHRIHKQKYLSLKHRLLHYVGQFVRFFDIFGARPMLNAQPQSSSCWGFFLTIVIIILSVLTFALTIKNMDSVKIITSHRYQQPQNQNFEITSGKNFRFAFCFDSTAANNLLTGTTKIAQLTFYKWSKKYGYQQMLYERMVSGQFQSYFQLAPQNPLISSSSQNCFRPANNQKVSMGGSYQTSNQAYFGARLDPYCSGTVSQCLNRKNKTISDFLTFINYRKYAIFLSENKYSPSVGKIISGITANGVSEADGVLDANLLRTETIFMPTIQLLDDTSISFARTSPKTLQRTISYSQFGDRNQQKKGNPNVNPGYVLQFRANGQVQSIILRSYKIDFLFGIIGGVFLFWYFFVHFFAKIYNSFKVRAKLAEILHQQDGYDESMLVQLLYLSKFPTFLYCCSQLRKDIERIQAVDDKIYRDLDYLQLTKSVDTCFRLSSSLFNTVVQKDISMIYFRQKIDQAQLVKPKRIKQLQNDEFQDDQFLQFDDDANINQQVNVSHNVTGNLLPQISAALDDHDVQKIINMNRSVQTCPLYDPFIPNKKQKTWVRILKKLDFFKNPPQLTLDGQRDVKSIFGGLAFFLVLALIIVVVAHFLTIYTNGSDYTVSHRNIVDADLSNVDSSSTLGDLSPGINILSGRDFKFAVTFNKKDQYFPLNVSQYIGPIGIRFLQYTTTKINGVLNQTYQSIQLQPCTSNYLNGFLSPYNDPQIYRNITLGYCLPDGKYLSLSGTPQDSVRKYFKFNIYNKYANLTGKAFLNSFFKIYLVQYHMSAPQLDVFSKDFKYEMTSFNFFTSAYSYPLQNNLTFSKVIFTDKYYSRSRQTYNDRTKRRYERDDIDQLSGQNQRNVSFYYRGNIDHYVLDYPGGGQLFGLVGGVIAMFIFIIYSAISSFNEYRMKYLIGQRLYTFDKKLSGLSKQKISKDKGNRINLKRLQQLTKAVNNFNQAQLLFAWLLNPIGFIRDDYNFSKTLRRVTLLVQRVQNDINLYNVYKNLLTFKDALDKKVKLSQTQQMQSPVTATSIYIKHIHQKESVKNHIPLISKQAKKHKFSCYQQFKINKAIEAKINPQAVFGDKFLNRAFGLDDGTSVLGSRMRMIQQRNNQSLIHASFVNNNITDRNAHRDIQNDTRLQQSEQIFAQSEENGNTNQNTGNIQAFQIQDVSQTN